MGRGSARLVVVVGLMLVMCSTTVLAATHVVGDAQGWGFSVSYESWSTGKAFAAGDALVFKYTAGTHNVVAVSASEYRSCKARGAAAAAATASGSATLNMKKGVNYFICGVPGHCAAGMKLRVVAN